MAARYELTDAQWAVVAAELPPRRNDRALWNVLLRMLCTGAAWRDLPVHYSR